jgi:predicted ester cyclase
MRSHHQKILERALEEIWNLGKEDQIERYYHADYVGRFNPPLPDMIALDGVRRDLIELREAFPDFHEECHALIGDGDTVAARITLSGTQRGPYFDHPSNGRRFEISTIDIYRFCDDRIIEQWGVMDMLSMIEQLGWGST